MGTTNTTTKVLREKANWRTLHFYQKADTLSLPTHCRFL